MTDSISQRIKNICSNVDIHEIPSCVKLELTNVCNHKCTYCFNSRIKHKMFMSSDIFYLALKQIIDAQIPEVGLFHIGESTLHPKLSLFHKQIKHANKNIRTFLTCNGTNLDVLKELVENDISSIKISLNGYDADSHYKLTKTNDFYEIISNLKSLVEYRNKIKSKTQISASAILNSHVEEQQKFIADIRKYVDDFYQTPLFTQGNNIKTINAKTDSSNNINTHEFPCYAPFNICYVMADGDMSICKWGRDKNFIIGNINDISIRDAWTSALANQIRQDHLNKKIQTCNECMSMSGSI